jgi:hypothetical protein
MGEIDVSLDGAGIDGEDELPTEQSSPVTQVGDLWIVGEHRIFSQLESSAETIEGEAK